jgi:hypothetical protein
MPNLSRLPNPSSDANQWGTILNRFLKQSHNELNGAINKFTIFTDRPTNLTPDDEGKTYLFTETGNFHEWNGIAWKVLNNSIVNVKDYGAIGDGLADDTAAIQTAVYRATAFMTLGIAYPAAGGQFPSTTVLFDQGAYRITDSIIIPTGLTIKGISDIAYTVSSCRIIMDTNSGTSANRNLPMFKFTTDYNGGTINAALTVNIADLEFWIVNPGASVTVRTGTGWGTSPANDNLGLYQGTHIYVDIPAVDMRVKRCNFYSAPNAAIYFNQPGTDYKKSNCFIEECEFDTPVVAVRANNSNLDISISDCEIWDNSYGVYIQNCKGNLRMVNNDLVGSPGGGTRIKVKDDCSLNLFAFTGNRFSLPGSYNFAIGLNKVESLNITGNSFTGAGTNSCIEATDCEAGVISSNNIVNSGYNQSPTSEVLSGAAIKLTGCKSINIIGNTVTTPSPSSYNGFGIFTLDNSSTSRTSRCLITNNIVTGSYNGAGYRSQSRKINISPTDISAGNMISL